MAEFNDRNYEKVVDGCRAALVLDPKNAQASHLCGKALAELGRHGEAEPYLRAATEADPRSAEAHADLASALREAGNLKGAEPHGVHAVALRPMDYRYRLLLADICEGLSRHAEALEQLAMAQECAPDDYEVLQRLMVKFDQWGQYAHALRFAERAMIEHGEIFETCFFLGYARYATGDYEGAVEACRRGIEIHADLPQIYVTLGSALLGLGRIDEAVAAYKRSVKVLPGYPDGLFHLGVVNLLRGRFRDGWAGFEYRFKIRRAVKRVAEPRWNGTSLRGRVLHVMREQGLGDDIMYSSCYPQLIQDARHCHIECEPRLEKLFARSFPEATFVPRTDNAAGTSADLRDDVDVRIFSASVPGYLRNSVKDFPRHQGYLKADPERTAHWRQQLDALGDGLKIGISWRGGSVYTNRARRTMSLDALHPLLELSGVHWVNLQYGDRAEEIARLKAERGIEVRDWPEAIDGDYDETAALVSALDLVISVCTSVIHLTGALGRPVWVMVPFAAEWRYGAEGEAMIWYPTARLFRQTARGDWESAMSKVIGALVQRLSQPAKA